MRTVHRLAAVGLLETQHVERVTMSAGRMNVVDGTYFAVTLCYQGCPAV